MCKVQWEVFLCAHCMVIDPVTLDKIRFREMEERARAHTHTQTKFSSTATDTKDINKIIEAAKSGNAEQLHIMFEERGFQVNICDHSICTSLHYASYYGHLAVVELLIKLRADVNAVDREHRTPLYDAADNGHVNIIQKLIQSGADVNGVRKGRSTPLHLAARNGHCQVVNVLIKSGADVNAKDEKRDTPLHDAAWAGHADVIEVLASSGATIDAANNGKRTALHIAAYNSCYPAVNKLIHFKANISAIDVEEDTPLHKALWNGNIMVVKILVQSGANINAVNIRRRAPLHVASWKGHVEAVKMLVKLGASMSISDVDGDTPLHEAARGKHNHTIMALIRLGARVDVTNNGNQTPLHRIIVEKNHEVLWELVNEMHIDISWLDEDAWQTLNSLLEAEATRRAKQPEPNISGLERSDSLSSQCSGGIESPSNTKHGLTRDDWNKGYEDGILPSLDVRIALIGPEGSGKTSLADTLTGQEFEYNYPTKGAEKLEVVVKKTENWTVINDVVNSLQMRMLQEAKHCATEQSKFRLEDVSDDVSAGESESSLLMPSQKKLKLDLELDVEMLSTEEFSELPPLSDDYDPSRRYISIWDYGGQQVFHHTHGLFMSEEMICLIVFDASKSLEEVPAHRHYDDKTPSRTGLESIMYWMELISYRVSRKNTSEDDTSQCYPVYILVGTHIDLLDPDIEKAKEIAHHMHVPLLKEKLEGKPFVKHIIGSNDCNLFDEGSQSIFFLSNVGKMREPSLIAALQQTIIRAAPIRYRPTKYVKVERKLLQLSYDEKLSVISLTQLKEVAKNCGVTEIWHDNENDKLVEYLKSKGTILYFGKIPDIIILCPQWLARLLTYVLTSLIRRPVKSPLTQYAKERSTEGLLREELLEWSVIQFNKDEVKRGQRNFKLTDWKSKVAELLLSFHLMADVTNSSLAKRDIPLKKNEKLYLVPHLLPERPIKQSSTSHCFSLFFYFTFGFISDTFIDQLIVKCTEWNGRNNFDLLQMSYQQVCMELGKHQVYQLRPVREKSAIELTIYPKAMMEVEEAHKLKNELISSMKLFINELMEQHMAVIVDVYPVKTRIICSKCSKPHIELEKIIENHTIWCPEQHGYVDMIESHMFWSGKSGTSLFAEQKPKMATLVKVVVPKVAHMWHKVAWQLDLDNARVSIIKKKCHGDPESCCEEMFSYWLDADEGIKPKQWGTLLGALKDIKDLTAAVKEIETELSLNS